MKKYLQAIVVAAIGVIQANACTVTYYPECSAYMDNENHECGDGVKSVTYSGGATVSKCGEASPGNRDCWDAGQTSCSYTITVTWCDGTVQSENVNTPVLQLREATPGYSCPSYGS